MLMVMGLVLKKVQLQVALMFLMDLQKYLVIVTTQILSLIQMHQKQAVMG